MQENKGRLLVYGLLSNICEIGNVLVYMCSEIVLHLYRTSVIINSSLHVCLSRQFSAFTTCVVFQEGVMKIAKHLDYLQGRYNTKQYTVAYAYICWLVPDTTP